jgi:predicted amino acid dehydrogenase
MSNIHRKITIINLMKRGVVLNRTIQFGGIDFRITEHRIGWDLQTAKSLIQSLDGFADGIAISGLPKNLGVGDSAIINPAYLMLIREAVRTPLYLADTSREFFSKWALQKFAKERPNFFKKKKVLFQYALASTLIPLFQSYGAEVWGCDAILITGKNLLLRGTLQMAAFTRLMTLSNGIMKALRWSPEQSTQNVNRPKTKKILEQWISACDVFVGVCHLIEKFDSLHFFSGKTLIVDHMTPELRERLESAGVSLIIELAPVLGEVADVGSSSFSALTAMIDQRRICEESPLNLDDYMLRCIEELNITPRKSQRFHGGLQNERRCAFIIHPLSQSQLCSNINIPGIERLPKSLKRLTEAGAARIPIYHYGSISGIVSQADGQRVICDLYAMPATPKMLLTMNEEFIYNRLIQGAELARTRGAGMIGLGAYTKVVGDAGVTVARRSPIPVTNGNSYSASATLWAAREMIERMGFINMSKKNGRYRAKAMIVGATGGIGRVSSLLVSLVCEELVLVAPRPDKLIELRDEILQLSPDAKIKMCIDPNPELYNTDLIVTATSNQSGHILDIMKVKPGAVICDCSRPMDIGPEEAAKRPDVMVIESGEIDLPGDLIFRGDIGLPQPSVYACLAETVLLTLEGKYESFSLSKQLSMEKVKEIYKIGIKHGAKLSTICGPSGVITEEQLDACRKLAAVKLRTASPVSLIPDPTQGPAGLKSVSNGKKPSISLASISE